MPHECVDLNILVTFALMKKLGKKVYYLTIVPDDDYGCDFHVVLSNKYIESGAILTFNGSYQEGDVILYDLIYPLCNLNGKSWVNRSHDIKHFICKECMEVSDIISAMGYDKSPYL